jgi:transposase
MTPADLAGLSSDEKDALICSLFERVAALEAVVLKQQAIIAELQARLAADSHNSNKPPSSDGFRKPPKPKSLRQQSGKKSGGQPGHPGSNLTRSDHPDRVVVHAPPKICDACDAFLPEPILAEARQVFDLPEIRYEVTEHRVLQAACRCGKLHRGIFPSDVSAPVQYGSKTLAAVVYLTNHHMMPVQRTAMLVNDLFGLSVSEGTVLAACATAEERLQPMVDAIAASLRTASVAHADETGLNVGGALHLLHVMATPLLTWVAFHKKRGKEAMIALNILPWFVGVLIHDGWESYRVFACAHGLCNAHHLRELIYLFEEMKQAWAGRMIDLLRAADHEVNQAAERVLDAERRLWYRAAYDAILDEGERDHPRVEPSGRRGRTKQSKATNLLGRLREHADDVWRFASDPDVPFTNNLAEQTVRMPKVKQKISGGFRTAQGAKTFCVIRSYLATMHKQGANLFDALSSAFEGRVPQPRFT